MYKVIALIGEAGSGKDTLMQSVLAKTDKLHEVISCTTRPPREGEVNGVNYHFLTGEQFGQKVLDGEMLEATCFNDWFYGTSYESLRSDCVNIGVFNPDGIDSMMAHKDVYVVAYYVRADEKQRLLRQLNREENPDVREIIRRFTADLLDFEELDFHYNEVINNTENDLAYATEIILSGAQMLEDKVG